MKHKKSKNKKRKQRLALLPPNQKKLTTFQSMGIGLFCGVSLALLPMFFR